MARDRKRLDTAMQNLGLEIHEAQLVLTRHDDETSVCSWLSNEGTLYLNGAMDEMSKEGETLQRALKEAGYHVKVRCYIS